MDSFMNSQAIFCSERPVAIKTRKFLVGLIYMNFLVFFQVSQAFVQPVANITFDFSTVTEDVLFKKKIRILKFGLSEKYTKICFGHLLSKRPKYEEDFFKFCVFLRKSIN